MIAILIVCAGNVCRSPYVERVLQARLDAVVPGGYSVSSAGTIAEAGAPMFPRSAEAVAQRGADASGFRATTLAAAVLADRSLVLTMEREQRAAVLDLAPVLLRRTFTLLEFARLVRPLLEQNLVGADFWDTCPRMVARSRLVTAPAEPSADDVADPVRGDAEDHDRMCDVTDAAIDVVVACAARAAEAVGSTEGADRARTAGA